MIEYCITFISDDEEPREVWYCHVVALRMVRELPADLMQSLEAVRVAVHGAAPSPQQASTHLH